MDQQALVVKSLGVRERWHTVEMNVEAIACEAVSYALMEAGALGTETRDSRNGSNITAYFDREPQSERIRLEMEKALRIYQLSPPAVREITIGELPNQDWLAEWKKHWQPVEVGGFIIAPPWYVSVPGAVATGSSDPSAVIYPVATAPGPDKILIRINPGMAFGTGTHETTRLCLKAIEKYYTGGSFLDVGTGTGILAIAAAKLAPDASIIGCDTDAEAIGIARENARLNDAGNRIDFRAGTIDEEMPSADLVCANLTAPVIVELLPSLLGVTCGRLVLSGILETQFEMVHTRLLEQAATVNEVIQDNEWLALVI